MNLQQRAILNPIILATFYLLAWVAITDVSDKTINQHLTPRCNSAIQLFLFPSRRSPPPHTFRAKYRMRESIILAPAAGFSGTMTIIETTVRVIFVKMIVIRYLSLRASHRDCGACYSNGARFSALRFVSVGIGRSGSLPEL